MCAFNVLFIISLFVTACSLDGVNVPTPQVNMDIPPEMIAIFQAATASSDKEDCPPEEHEAEETPIDGIDADHDGVTEAEEVDWFDPMSIHGEITVFCPDSCTIRMNLANGFKWRWLIPGTTNRVTEFTFAGELRVPASEQAEFQISVGGPLEAPAEAYVEVSLGNLLRIISLRHWDGKTQASVFQKLHLYPNEVGKWVVFQVLYIQEPQTE